MLLQEMGAGRAEVANVRAEVANLRAEVTTMRAEVTGPVAWLQNKYALGTELSRFHAVANKNRRLLEQVRRPDAAFREPR
jgi:hypothetical protein